MSFLATFFARDVAIEIGTETILTPTDPIICAQRGIFVTVGGRRLIASDIVAGFVLSAARIHAGLDAFMALFGVGTEAAFVANTIWLEKHELRTIAVASGRPIADHARTGVILAPSFFASMIASDSLALVEALWPVFHYGASALRLEHDEVLVILAIRGRRLGTVNFGTGRINARSVLAGKITSARFECI